MSDRYKGAILSPTAPTVIPQSAGGVYTLSQQLQYQGQGVWPPAISYPVNNSLRFRSSASAYLNRTPASAGNRQKWTWSGWVKRGALSSGSYMDLFTALSGANDFTEVRYHFNTNDDTLVFTDIAGGVTYAVYSTNVYRDASAWYHIVCSVDTTQATNTNRVKLYVNGVQVTQNAGGSGYPLQNTNTSINATVEHRHGGIATYGRYFDGYMAEINFIDGQALTPSSFGTTDAYGIWQPIPYTGTYGTNGFYLPFTNTTSTSTLGNDFSGNSNTWTVNNISLTAGTTYDSMKDVPTNTNSNTANYCVMNPLDNYNGGTISNGNLTVTTSGTNSNTRATFVIPRTGKWYFETTDVVTGGNNIVGIANSTLAISASQTGATGSIYTGMFSNAVYGFAFNFDALTYTIYKNNSVDASGSITSGIDYAIFVATSASGGASTAFNFGQRPFAYTPPSGFYPLNTYNLPTPTILDGDQYFNAVLWTGNGSTPRAFTGIGFAPDFAWIKSRSTAADHALIDIVRGTGSKALSSNTTSAENGDGLVINSFDSDGYTLATGSINFSYANTNAANYVSWNWKANGTGSSNTQGTITSTVSANTTAGFSIVTYTGNGSNSTIGHGLGVAPSMVIVKQRNTAQSWCVWHTSIGLSNVLFLNGTNASTSYPTLFNSMSTLNSTVFSIGTDIGTNQNTGTYVAYNFAQVAGYSAFGSYTGNSSTDGPFIYTGFRPRFVLIKLSSAAGANWEIYDSARNTYNATDLLLLPSSSSAEGTFGSYPIDLLSNGFKVRGTGSGLNDSGQTLIYACFAENPFKIARAR